MTSKRCRESRRKKQLYVSLLREYGRKGPEIVPPRPTGRPKIAVDQQVAFEAFAPITAAGVDIIYEAGHGEPDEVWLAGAFIAGVDAVASPDFDIGIFCLRHDLGWIKLPSSHEVTELGMSGFGAREQAEVITSILRRWRWIPALPITRSA